MDLQGLADHSLLRGLGKSELDAIARTATEREFAPGEALTIQGHFGHCLFLIESGTADVTIDGEQVRSVGPGDTVGEIALLSTGRRTASVVATSRVRAAALFKRDVWALEREAPDAAGRLRAAIAEYLGAPEELSNER
jgi:CRP-like cAMP-binding protein